MFETCNRLTPDSSQPSENSLIANCPIKTPEDKQRLLTQLAQLKVGLKAITDLFALTGTTLGDTTRQIDGFHSFIEQLGQPQSPATDSKPSGPETSEEETIEAEQPITSAPLPDASVDT